MLKFLRNFKEGRILTLREKEDKSLYMKMNLLNDFIKILKKNLVSFDCKTFVNPVINVDIIKERKTFLFFLKNDAVIRLTILKRFNRMKIGILINRTNPIITYKGVFVHYPANSLKEIFTTSFIFNPTPERLEKLIDILTKTETRSQMLKGLKSITNFDVKVEYK